MGWKILGIFNQSLIRSVGCLDWFRHKVIEDPPHASLENSPGRRTRVLKIFERHLKVKPVAGTQLVEVSYRSSSPQLSAAVINELTKGLVDYTFQTRYNATNEASKWLAGQMNDLKQQAETLQAKVVQLQREAGVYSLGAVGCDRQRNGI